MARLRQDRGEVTVTIARRRIRKWLRESEEGKQWRRQWGMVG